MTQLYLKLQADPKKRTPLLAKSLERVSGTKTKVDDYVILPHGALADWRTTFMSELVEALGSQGAHAGSSVPLLLALYGKSGEQVNVDIVVALGHIGPAASEAIPVLGKLLRSESPRVREAAMRALELIARPPDSTPF